MPITASQLQKYAPVNTPENNSSISGGAIDITTTLKSFVQASATIPKIASSNAGDSMNVTLYGIDATGNVVSETKALSGTSQVAFTQSFVYLLKLTTSSAPAGNVTVYMNDGTTVIVVLDAGKRNNRVQFYDAASDENTEIFLYEKEYWKNEHGTLSLTTSRLALTADSIEDATHDVQVAVEASSDQSVANRLTAPSGGLTFVDEATDILIGSLAAGASKGLWTRCRLGAAAAQVRGTYQTRLAGQTVD